MAVMQFFEIDDYFKRKYEEEADPSSYATIDPYGNYKEIPIPSDISIGGSKDNYYDVGTIENEKNGAVYPVLNLIDYYTNMAVGSILNPPEEDYSPDAAGLTTLDLSQMLLNKSLYQSDNNTNIPGLSPMRIEESIPNDDRNLAAIIRDPDTASPFERYANRYFHYNEEYWDTEENFNQFKKDWIQSSENEALKYLDNFQSRFGPFRSAVNKSIKELGNTDTMKELLINYKDAFAKHFDISNDEDMSKQVALKQILGGALEAKLGEQEVLIPDFMRGNMFEMWVDYNLGITTPELNLQAMMFHNDGFKKIIDTFNQYLESGEQLEIKDPKPWGMNISYDDYKNPEKYHNNLNVGINELLLRLNQGKPTSDPTVLNGQINAIQSYLLKDAINQTHSEAAEGYVPFGSPWTWWLIPGGTRTAYTAYQNTIARNTIAAMGGNLDDFILSMNKNADILVNKYGWPKPKGKPNLTWFQRGIKAGKKIPKNFIKNRIGSAGLALFLAEAGPDIVRDLGGYMFGGDSSDNYPKTYYGRQIFNSFGWQPDAGERNYKQKPIDSIGEFALSVIVGPMSQGESFYGAMHKDMKEIYKDVSTVIVHSHNDAILSTQALNTAGLKIISDIQNSEEFKSISNKDEQEQYFLKEFYNKAFNGNEYQKIFSNYVQSHNTFEGALNIMGRLSISGEKAGNMILRQVPKPESFPQKLWDELHNLSEMNEEDYISNYGDISENMKRSIPGFNEAYGKYTDYDNMWYGIKGALSNLSFDLGVLPDIQEEIRKLSFSESTFKLQLPEDDRYSAYPYEHPSYGGSFNPVPFKEIQTNAQSIYNLPQLRNALIKVDKLLKDIKE
tara:strand:+ start:12035 stop:14560 length:2526 start_codon:yes stop_codon:yes gene_type:complete